MLAPQPPPAAAVSSADGEAASELLPFAYADEQGGVEEAGEEAFYEEEDADDSSQSRVPLSLSRSLHRSHPSLFQSSIVHPSLDDCIDSCSRVLHRLIVHNDTVLSASSSSVSSPASTSSAASSASTASTSFSSPASTPPTGASPRSPSGCLATDPFHIGHFLRPSYVPFTAPPLSCSPLPFSLFHQQPSSLHIPCPSAASLASLLRHVFSHVSVDPSCVIICVIYLERLQTFPPPLLLCSSNCVLLLLTALLVALKVWDDRQSYNVDFTQMLPLLSTREMARLEATFVQHLHWTLYISASEYAHYFYALRAESRREGLDVGSKTRAKLYTQLHIGGGRDVQDKTNRREGEQREMPQSL